MKTKNEVYYLIMKDDSGKIIEEFKYPTRREAEIKKRVIRAKQLKNGNHYHFHIGQDLKEVRKKEVKPFKNDNDELKKLEKSLLEINSKIKEVKEKAKVEKKKELTVDQKIQHQIDMLRKEFNSLKSSIGPVVTSTLKKAN